MNTFLYRFRIVRAFARFFNRGPVQCHTCPNWIYHGPQFYKPQPIKERAPIPNMFRYDLAKPRFTMMADAETIYAPSPAEERNSSPNFPGITKPQPLPEPQPHPKIFLHQVGICRLDTPALSNVGKLGFSFRAWTATDWCPRHPLYKPILAGSGLDALRTDHGDGGTAGLNRAPSIEEALRFLDPEEVKRMRDASENRSDKV